MKKNTKANRERKPAKKSDANESRLYKLIFPKIHEIIPEVDMETKHELASCICQIIYNIDEEVQYIRDSKLRDFLRKHIDKKPVNDFMASIAKVRVYNHIDQVS